MNQSIFTISSLTSAVLASTFAVAQTTQGAYLKASDHAANWQFAISVAVDAGTVVVGAQGANEGAGRAYVYAVNGGGWVEQAVLAPIASQQLDSFGGSVAIDGDTIVVGAPNQGLFPAFFPTGAAYVFVRSGTTWTQQAVLHASNAGFLDLFGSSVAISQDTIVVGASNESSAATGVDGNELDDSAGGAGAAYVFVRSGSTWTQQAYLKASSTDAGDNFGRSVAVSGETVVVGAVLEDSNAIGIDGNAANNGSSGAGAAYVFVRSGSSWAPQAYLKASNTDAGDNFGHSVCVSGDTIAVGSLFEDSAATGINGDEADDSVTGAGAAYVFVRNGTSWSQQAYVKASNSGLADQFGFAISLDGDRLLVGAPTEDSAATGVDGNQADDSASQSGAAYVYDRVGSTWSQANYLKASNTDIQDIFGLAVGVSGDVAIVGAPEEASASTGVNGNQADDSIQHGGAGYVFGVVGNGGGVSGPIGGCPGEPAPTVSGTPSASSAFSIVCPALTTSCVGGTVLMFGACSPFPITVPPPIGCGPCELIVSPVWGTTPGSLMLPAGAPVGGQFCVQCGCIATSCVNLSAGLMITITP